MDIVIDVSAILAVVIDEPERGRIIELTRGQTLVGPGSIEWEVGNAFSAMFKQRRLTLEEAINGLSTFQSIPVRYLPIDFNSVLSIAHDNNVYAYDAYVLECAKKYGAPLLTLDHPMQLVAKRLGIQVLEV